MSYPTPDKLRAHAKHARQMADEYRSEGNHKMADRRDEDANWYEILCAREEWRIECERAEHHTEAA
ncbi:hypothetical protein [Sinorhizobium meliloti]|uniref:hypothetical protein n=1 Tax=Rhizobium meliloti TaxID=382 RepID=UPI000FD9A2EB|nr:hypothetical protein [Sinorhizobium meliloti]RVQ10040.1 hypothetical protein CN067_34065 [Sinorhizobium meliloti]RVQ55755.1 hypothetical protein CN060_21140 [Sinorhizobium meliloti]